MEKLAAVDNRLETAWKANLRDYEAEVDRLDAKKNQLLARAKKLDEKKLECARANGNVDICGDDLVEINVGGKVIAVSRSTLTQCKGSRFEALFSGRWDEKLVRDDAGRIFLDVNPICFQAIVDCLGEMKISDEDSPAAPPPPSVEPEYQDILVHQLELFGLYDEFSPLNSRIIRTDDHFDCLHDWLDEDGYDGDFILQYRSSRDGRNDATFHSKCDSMGPTLTVVETTEGNIIGGYSDVVWKSENKERRSNKAFLFAISKTNDFGPSKMKLMGSLNRYAIENRSSYGPTFGATFGGGRELSVEGPTLYLNIGHTYTSPPDQLKHTSGKLQLNIKEMEVFQVVPWSSSNPRPKKAGKIQANNAEATTPHLIMFSPSVTSAINQKWAILAEAEAKISGMEASFKDEASFITSISCEKDKALISLNIFGTPMTTLRETMHIHKDAVLASEILDGKQDCKDSNSKPVKQWNTHDVVAWLNGIDGLDISIVKNFEEDEVTGRELLALGKEGLMDFGVAKKGTIFYLLSEIEKLKTAQSKADILVEHSPYCFEKIIDHLRLESMFIKGLIEHKPGPPAVRASEKSRFAKLVKHFFPGDCCESFLGN